MRVQALNLEHDGADVLGARRDMDALSALDGLGVGPATVDRIDRESRSVFDMRGMRAGQPYTAFMEHDSLGRRLRHFVYEKNPTDYIVVSLAGDSVTVRQESKEVNWYAARRRRR